MGRRRQPVEVRHGPEHRVDVRIVGHVVAEVRERRRVERRDPQRVDAEPRKVVEPRGDAREVSDAVAVRVLERAGIDLVDDSVAPRHRPRRVDDRFMTMIESTTTHEIDPLTDPRWDAYVRAHPRASVYHLGAWATDPRALIRIRAALPGLERGTAPWRACCRCSARRASSRTPACARSRCSPTAGRSRTTTRSRCELSRPRVTPADVAGLTINTDDRRMEPPDGFELEELPPRWMVERAGGPRRAARGLAQDVEQPVPQPQEGGQRGTSRSATARSPGDLRSFHRMYVRTMKKHRSLPRSLRQLRLAQELLGERSRLFLVSHAGRDIAGGVYHVFGDTVELVYNGSEDERAADAAQPRALLERHAVGRGNAACGRVNLGGADADTPLARSRSSGARAPHALPPHLPRRRGADPDGGASCPSATAPRTPSAG